MGATLGIGIAVLLWSAAAALALPQTVAASHFLVRSPVTLVHEFSHVVAATLTGGFSWSLRLSGAGGARVKSVHLTLVSHLVTPFAGYMGPPVVGALVVALDVKTSGPMWDSAPVLLFGIVGVSCLLLSRDWRALLASVWLLTLVGLLMQTGWTLLAPIGLALCLVGTIDTVRLVILHSRFGSDMPSDAVDAGRGIVPPVAIAVLWATVSVACAVAAVLVLVRVL